MQVINQQLQEIITSNYYLESTFKVDSNIFEHQIFFYKSKGLFKKKVAIISLKEEYQFNEDNTRVIKEPEQSILSETEQINSNFNHGNSMAYIIFGKVNNKQKANYFSNYFPTGTKLHASIMLYNEKEKEIYFDYKFDQPIGYSIKKTAKIINTFYLNK